MSGYKQKNKQVIDGQAEVAFFSFSFSLILASRYLVRTIMDPSEVQISSRITLLVGSLVISKVASSLNWFLLSFSKK